VAKATLRKATAPAMRAAPATESARLAHLAGGSRMIGLNPAAMSSANRYVAFNHCPVNWCGPSSSRLSAGLPVSNSIPQNFDVIRLHSAKAT
jgi:hypothetical protein